MSTFTATDQKMNCSDFYQKYKDVYGVIDSTCETIAHALIYYYNGIIYQRVNGNKTVLVTPPQVYDQILGYIRSELKAKMISRDPIGIAFFGQNQEVKNNFIADVQDLIPVDTLNAIYTDYYSLRQQFLSKIVQNWLFPMDGNKLNIECFKSVKKCNRDENIKLYPAPFSYPLGSCALSDVIGYPDDTKDYDYVGPYPVDPNRQRILYGLYKPGCLRERNFYVLN